MDSKWVTVGLTTSRKDFFKCWTLKFWVHFTKKQSHATGDWKLGHKVVNEGDTVIILGAVIKVSQTGNPGHYYMKL